ncbi:MAG: CbiX/SirB N-terminal domain-containing protein [Verrucomicrobiia bacterium]
MKRDHSKDALVLAGHGSTLNADSSGPTYQHADEIRARGIFAEVHEAFWKEEPHFRDVLKQVEAERVYVVPNFISEGYFTEQVIPREFGLAGRVSEVEGREVIYCDPVGVHPSMTEVLLKRARDVVGEVKVVPEETALFIVGHGTSLNQNSVKVIYRQVETIRGLGIYGECQAAFMEQEPLISRWAELTGKPNVVVVPFFISDGLHSYEDIPVLLGISENVREHGFRNPTKIGARRLWYATAIGTEPGIVEVILALVELADESERTVSPLAA